MTAIRQLLISWKKGHHQDYREVQEVASGHLAERGRRALHGLDSEL